MKRKAILIEASNVQGEAVLPGAAKDVMNWLNFLKSPLGGSWDPTEIFPPYNKPSKAMISGLLKAHQDCYCFVVFSGHGRNGSVVLNDQETEVLYKDLFPQSTKGTLIVDACRGTSDEGVKEGAIAVANSRFTSRSSRMTNLSALHEMDYTETHKDVWLRALQERTDGIVRMLSCSKGQGADEDPDAGGYYTSLLMAGAKEWRDDDIAQELVFSTLKAHDYAAKNLPQQQTPQYLPDRTVYFPFAVKMTSQLNGLLEKAELIKNGRAGTSSLGSIGLVGPSFAISNPTHQFYG